MRYLFTILPIAFLAFFQTDPKKQRNESLTGYWVSKQLKYYDIDAALGGGQTMYGAGYLLKLESTGQATSIGADFRWEHDSLYQGGEPGRTIKIGAWQRKDQSVLLSQQLVSKTIMLTGDRIGQAEIDSVFVLSDGTLLHKKDTLIFVKNPSKELETIVERIVTFHKRNNSS